MGLRERIEREVRAALKQAGAEGGRINVTGRVNKVIVRNVGGGAAAATADQQAPIVQEPPTHGSDESD